VRVHSVHVMNVEQRHVAADPQTKPPDLGCEFACRLLLSTTTIAIYYYYSARKLILSFDDDNDDNTTDNIPNVRFCDAHVSYITRSQ